MKRALLLLMLPAGCTSYAPASLDTDLSARDDSTLQISGTPIFSDLGESLLYLCPAGHAGDPTGSCLDVVAPVTLVAKLRNSATHCIAVSGKFIAFGPDRVGLGNYRMKLAILRPRTQVPVIGANNSFKPNPLRGSA